MGVGIRRAVPKLSQLMVGVAGQDLAEFVLLTGIISVAVVAGSGTIATVLVNALTHVASVVC
jgi:Flp pilus assembly pilin Flp